MNGPDSNRSPRALVAALSALVASTAACGDEEPRSSRQLGARSNVEASPESSSGAGGTGGAGGAGGGTRVGGDQGGEGGEGGEGGQGVQGALMPLGSIEIVDVPDTGCEKVVGTSVELYPAESNPPAFSVLSRLGDTRVAGGRFAGGFVTWDLHGEDPSAAPKGLDPEYNLIASTGESIDLVTADGSAIRFQRYGADEGPIGAPIKLADAGGAGLGIGGDAGSSLVVWWEAASMHALAVDGAGAVKPAFAFGANTPSNGLRTTVVGASGSFVAVWSAVDAKGTHTRLARLGATAPLGPEIDLTGTSADHYLVDAVRTPNGYAILLNGGSPVLDTYLVLLDDSGAVKGPARHLVGAKFGWDLAVAGSSIGVVAKRADGSAEIRSFDAAGEPLGDWRCLDAPSSQTYDMAAIDADGEGFAIVYRTPEGAEQFVRTNVTGTSEP
jgi:hypothetical protein